MKLNRKKEEEEEGVQFKHLRWKVIKRILETFEIELKYYEDYTFSFFYGYFRKDNMRNLFVAFPSVLVQSTDQLDVIPLKFMKNISSSKRDIKLRFPYILAHQCQGITSMQGFFLSKKTIKVLSRSNRRNLVRLTCYTSKMSDRVLESLNSFRRLRHLWLKTQKKKPKFVKPKKAILTYDQLRKERKKTKDVDKKITKSLVVPSLITLHFENIWYDHMLVKQIQHCPNLKSVTICKSEVKKRQLVLLNNSKTITEVRFIKSKVEDYYVNFFYNSRLLKLEINDCNINIFLLKNLNFSQAAVQKQQEVEDEFQRQNSFRKQNSVSIFSNLDNKTKNSKKKMNQKMREDSRRILLKLLIYNFEELVLLKNDFPLELIEGISRHYRNLRTLHFSIKNLTDEYVDAMNGVKHLKHLMIHSTRKSGEKFESTINDFEDLTELKSLKIKSMKCSPSLLYFLIVHRYLKKLVIKDSVIQDRQIMSISRNQTIRILKINDCELTTEMYKIFSMKQLIELDLNNCFGFKCVGFEDQMKIPKGSMIEKLSLFGITISVKFFKKICDHLAKMKEILLVECDLDKPHFEVLRKYQYWKNTIVTLYVNSDDVLNRVMEEIQSKHPNYNFVKV